MILDDLEMMLIFDNKPFVNISQHNFIFRHIIMSSPTVILQYLCSFGKAKVLDLFSTNIFAITGTRTTNLNKTNRI